MFFQSCNFTSTLWRLPQKLAVHTTSDVYVVITIEVFSSQNIEDTDLLYSDI